MKLLFFRLNVLTKVLLRGLCGLALLGLSGIVQAQLTVSPTNFSPAQSGRIWMDIGGVWNGTTVVAKDNGSAVLDGDEFSFVYTNDVATQFEFKPQIAFPAGVFIPATGAKGARIDTIGTSCPAGMAVSSLTNAAGIITLNLIPATGAGGFDLPPGCSFTLRINGMIAKTAPASTITISANALIAPTDGGATSLVTGGAKGALVRSGASTLSKMPNNQTRAKDAVASWPNGLIVQNTGLGGLFDVTLNESAIVAGGGLSLIATSLIAPGATCAAGVCTQAYLAPAAALTGSAQATVTSCQGILNTLSTTDLTLATAKATSAQVTLDLQQPLLNFTPPSFTIPFGGSVNASLTVTNTSSGAAKSSAAGGILFTTNYPALGVNIVLSPGSLAAGWTYTTGVSGGVFRYNASILGVTGSVPLSFTASESNACTFTSGVVQWTTAYSDDCGNFFNVPTQISTVTKDTAVPNVLLNKSASVGYRQIVGSAGSYTITSTGVNTAGLSGTSITVTDTLPAGITIGSITPSSGTFTCGGPCVAGSTLQWIYPKSNTAQTLTINYNAPTNVCTAGTTINNTASYSGTTNAPSSCPINANSAVGVLLTLPPGTGVSQLYNITGATNTIYEAGLPDGNNNGVSDKPLLSPFLNEGDLIPVIAQYSFGTATVGTWAGSLHSDNFGGLPASAARLAASTLKVQIDLGAGAGFGPAITVPPASVVCGSGGVATNNCDTNLSINLAFLSGTGFFNSPNVAPATGVRQIRFTYSTTINDSVLPAPTLGRAQRQITQLGKLTLAGAVGGCLGNEFTQGDIYILARAVATASVALPTVLDVCQPIDAPITLSNLTPTLRLNNLQTILNTTAVSDWRYLVGQPTPPYTGLYPTTVPVSFVTAVLPATTPSPTWTNQTPAQRFNGVATMTPKVFIKATQPAGVLPAPLTVQVSYDDNQTAGATRDFTGATGTSASANISVIRKADIVATVSPQTVFVVGSTVQWRVFITNTGSGTAYGATFTDTLPGPLTPNPTATNTSNNTTSCAPVATPCIVSGTGQVVTFNLGDIPPGQTRAVNIVATVNNSAPSCPEINSAPFNAKWGCGEPFENAQSINPARPTFVFPRGQLIVQHDSASSTCVLCGVGSTVIRLRNTGATNVFNMSLTETLNPTPQGVTLIGSDYSLDGISWIPINNLGAPTNAANSTYTWTSTQVPALAQLWPMVLTTPTQPFEVLIRLNFSTNNLTASVANPQFIAQTTGVVACGFAVDTGAQAFNLTVQKPLVSVAKTATNRSAIVSPGAVGTGVFTESVFGGAGDVIEWKVVVTNTGTAPALNVRLTDVFAATGGTGQQIVAGPSCTQTPAVAYPINLSNGIATANLCNLPNTVGSNTHTYYIRETIGSANACVTATNTADVTYGCSAGGGLNGRSGIAGGSDPATIIRAPNFGTFTSAGAQTFIQEAGGRMRVEVVLDNTGGTAQTLSLANTLPAGWKLDTSFAAKVYGSASSVAAASCTAPPTASAGPNYTCTCTSTACLTGVTVNNTNAAIPVFTLLGQMRNATQARLVFYVLPTNYDATSATTFPNLATNEGNPALDPVPVVAANNSIALNVVNT